jgi:hypothetical protein
MHTSQHSAYVELAGDANKLGQRGQLYVRQTWIHSMVSRWSFKPRLPTPASATSFPPKNPKAWRIKNPRRVMLSVKKDTGGESHWWNTMCIFTDIQSVICGDMYDRKTHIDALLDQELRSQLPAHAIIKSTRDWCQGVYRWVSPTSDNRQKSITFHGKKRGIQMKNMTGRREELVVPIGLVICRHWKQNQRFNTNFQAV